MASDCVDRTTIETAIRDKRARFDWDAFDTAIIVFARQRAREVGDMAPSRGWLAYTCKLVRSSTTDTYLRGINRLINEGLLTKEEFIALATLTPPMQLTYRAEP